jgi:hypothetical protein
MAMVMIMSVIMPVRGMMAVMNVGLPSHTDYPTPNAYFSRRCRFTPRAIRIHRQDHGIRERNACLR